MRKFKIGDKVRLISGSDEMTVYAIFGFRLVECEWVGKEGKVYKNSFRPEYLELATSSIENKEISKSAVGDIAEN